MFSYCSFCVKINWQILKNAAMNIHIDLSGLEALFSIVSLEHMLGAAVLALAAAIFILAWKLKK